MQVEVGHIMIEHRKPALLDSFFQVLHHSQYDVQAPQSACYQYFCHKIY